MLARIDNNFDALPKFPQYARENRFDRDKDGLRGRCEIFGRNRVNGLAANFEPCIAKHLRLRARVECGHSQFCARNCKNHVVIEYRQHLGSPFRGEHGVAAKARFPPHLRHPPDKGQLLRRLRHPLGFTRQLLKVRGSGVSSHRERQDERQGELTRNFLRENLGHG